MKLKQLDHNSRPERRTPHVLCRVFALLAAGLGLVALFGWVAGLPLLTTFANGWKPMAPSTALLFLLCGTAVFFHDRVRRSPRSYRIGLAFGWSVTAISLLLLIQFSLGVHPVFEHLGMHIVGTMNGIIIGHMSPVTASCFALIGVSFLALLSSFSGRQWSSAAAFGVAFLVVWSGIALLLAYLHGVPVLYDTTVIPPSLPTSLAFLMLGTSLLMSSGQRIWPRDALSDTASRRTTYVLVVTFVLLATSIITAGVLYLRYFEGNYRAEIENQLSAIADLKTEELANWREDYLKDAAVLFKNPSFHALTRRYLENSGDADVERQLQTWLGLFPDRFHFDQVRLIDTQGVTRMLLPGGLSPISSAIREVIPEVLRPGQVMLKDFYFCDYCQKVHLAVLVPILDETDGDRLVGVLALRIDPTTYLYPLIRKWPTPSPTAEALLVRREGNDVVFLNDLRFSGDAALRLRFSLDGNEELPAVKAVLGQEGIVEGVDYRGVPVIAAVHAVPNSPWFLVARMDKSEVYAPVRERVWMMFGLVGILLLGAGAAVGLAWQQRRLQFSREQHKADEALRESEQRLRAITDNADVVIFLKGVDGRYLFVNRLYEKLFHVTNAGIQGKTDYDIFPREMAEALCRNDEVVVQTKQPLEIEERVPHDDGIHTYISIKFPLHRSSGEVYAVCGIATDITERKRAEVALRHERDRAQSYLDTVETIIVALDTEGKITTINRKGCQLFGYPGDELVGQLWFATCLPQPEGMVDVYPFFLKLITGEIESLEYFENSVVTRSGEVRQVAWHNALLRDEQGRIVGTLSSGEDITESKQVKQALVESEERLRDITFSMADWVWEVNEKGVYTHSSHHVSDILGRSSEEVVGKTPFDFMPPEEAQRVAEIFSEIVANKAPIRDLANWNIRKDGKRICLLTNGVPILDEEGNLKGYRGVDKDITERKQAEEALEKAKARYEEIFNGIHEGIGIVDENEIIRFANQAFAWIFEEESPEVLIGRSILDFMPEDQRTIVLEQTGQRRERHTSQYELAIVARRGTRKTILASVSPRLDADGRFIGSFGAVLDITERKHAEEALREREAFLSLIIENIPDMIFVKDAKELNFVRFNKAGEKLLGYKREDLIGKNDYDFFPREQADYFTRKDREVLEIGQLHEIPEESIDTKHGKRILHTKKIPITDNTGKPMFLLGISRDITERKEAEQTQVRLVAMLDATPGFVGFADARDTRILYINPAGRKMVGVQEQEDVTRLKIADVHPEWTNQLFRDEIIPTAIRDGMWTGECAFLDRDGRETPVMMALLAHKSPSGEVERFSTISMDITERKRFEEALQQLSARNEALLASVPDIIIEVDANKVYTWSNKSGYDFFGDDVIGKQAAHYFEGEQTTYQTVRPLFDGHEDVFYVESWQRRRDGEKRLLAWWCKVRKDTNGNVIGALSTGRDITEQRRAAEALQIIGEEYRTLVNNVPLSVYRSTPDGRVLSANPASVRMMGYDSKEEYCAKPAQDSYADPHRRQEFLDELQKHGFVTDFESQMIRKDGRVIWISVNATVRRNEKGDIEYIDGTEEDITERKHAEEALRTAEERYRLLFERAGEGILVAQDGKVILSNPAVTAISGYSPEELSRQPFTEFIHPGDRELVLDRHRRRLSGEDIPSGYDFRIVTRDGAIKTMNIGSTMISWEGTPASLNFLADVTSRRQAEEEIRKFKTISDNALYGMIICAPDGTIVYANRAMAQMHGYLPDEVVGRHISMFHTDRQMDAVRAIIRETLKTGGLTPTELWHLHRDGTEFPTLVSGTTINNTAGQPQLLASSVIDTTELKHLQELADRAHRLEAAGRIAGQVAHDFNNLLGPLVAYPGLMREELGEGHPVNAYLEPMEAAAQQMAEINQQLLTLGRRGHYILEPLDLNEVIRQVLEQIQPQYPNLAVVAALAADLMNISGGVAQIARVITNLITNAVDAMHGIGTLTITSENWYAEEAQGIFGQIVRGEYAKVTISDTGCGIPKDVLPHVFEPFFSTKKADRKRGSGLGLSVVQAVVEDHHGYIDIDSVVGRGTSILLCFPITRDEILHGGESIVSGGNESVLVVDDDATQRDVTLRLLQKLRYRAEAVDCGEAALQRLQFESFDLLILDMVMPGGLDGADTYRRAKELHLDQRAIIVSGFAESDRVAEALRIGAGSFIKKPLTLKSLAAAVHCELGCERVIETVR